MSLARDHVFTSFEDHVGAVYRNPDVPDVRFSLVDPPAGLVLQIVDASGPDERDAPERWLLETHLPGRLDPGSPATAAMLFRDPREVWAEQFVDEVKGVAASGSGARSSSRPSSPAAWGRTPTRTTCSTE